MPGARPGPAIERPFARSVTVASPLTDPLANLTERERAALAAMCESVSIQAAADALFIQYQTLKNALTSAYKKLGVTGENTYKGARACRLLGLHEGRHERDDAKPPDALFRATS